MASTLATIASATVLPAWDCGGGRGKRCTMSSTLTEPYIGCMVGYS